MSIWIGIEPIPGVACLDLMTAFEKLWVLKNGQMDSKKLDNVGLDCASRAQGRATGRPRYILYRHRHIP